MMALCGFSTLSATPVERTGPGMPQGLPRWETCVASPSCPHRGEVKLTRQTGVATSKPSFHKNMPPDTRKI